MRFDRHQLVLWLKRLLYGRTGEPYRVAGFTLRYVPGSRPVRLSYASSANANVRYDALQIRLFSTQLAPGDTAIDIGAHGGQYSVLMSAMCGPTGQVVSFEPDPYALDLLRRNLALNPSIKPPTIEACAVADRSGHRTLYSRHGNSQSSLARAAVETSSELVAEAIEVPAVSLDEYLLARRLPEPRWVKIDTEGAEILVLRGAARLLAGGAGIVCELHPYAWSALGTSLAELKAIVAASGRSMRYLDQTAPIGDHASYGTVLLERR
jgi:FkbM family methyltransferase